MTDNFYFVKEPIVEIKSDNSTEVRLYELLLRTKYSHKFPGAAFLEEVTTEMGNQNFLLFVTSQLQEYLQRDGKHFFAINIEKKQTVLKSTFIFLKTMQNDANRLVLEITERDYEDITYQDIVHFINFAKRLGYKVFLDDIDNKPNNNLSLCALNIVDGIKLSRSFTQNFNDKCSAMVGLKSKLSNCVWVMEGIENHKQYEQACSIGITYQQGFFFKGM